MSHGLPPRPPLSPGPSAQTIGEYYRTMRQFLSTHGRLMERYLTGPADDQPPPHDVAAHPRTVAAASPPTIAHRDPTNDAPAAPLVTSWPPEAPAQASEAAAEPPAGDAAAPVDRGPAPKPWLPRYVIGAKSDPAEDQPLEALPSGVYLISPDRIGIAEALAARLELDGVRACILPRSVLADEAALGRWVTEQRTHQPIRALIHLAAIGDAEDSDPLSFADWQSRTRNDVHLALKLLRFTGSDLTKDGRVLIAGAMGGLFGRDGGEGQTVFAGFAASAGIAGVLGRQHKQCRARAIDLDIRQPAETLSEHLYQELRLTGGQRQLGYPQGRRTVFRVEPASLQADPIEARQPTEQWVVLAVGGARGITAACLRELAAYRPTLVLIEEPSVPDDAEAAANIAAFEGAGARVMRRSADLRDETAVRDLLSGIYDRHGRIDAVIYGAGCADAGLLAGDAEPDVSLAFDAIVDGAFLLCRHLRPESLKALAFLTFGVARYGDGRHAATAAANEAMTRYAWMLQAAWGPAVKVAAIDFDPWERASAGPLRIGSDIRRRFEDRGIALVDPDEGSNFLMREWLHAPAGNVEAIGGEGATEPDATSSDRGVGTAGNPRLPLLAGATIAAGARTIRKTIDIASDPYLDDHRLYGMPVMPFVVGAEYAAEAAEALGLPGRVIALRDIRRFQGVPLRDREQAIEISAAEVVPGREIKVEIRLANDRRLAYGAVAALGSAAPAPPLESLPRTHGPSPVTPAKAYDHWLFHGPALQTIEEIVSLTGNQIIGRLRSTRPREFGLTTPSATWLFDPGLIDGATQLVCVWARHHRDLSNLATAMASLERFGDDAPAGEMTIVIDFLAAPDDPLVSCDFRIVDAGGRLRLRGRQFQATSSGELNRMIAFGFRRRKSPPQARSG